MYSPSYVFFCGSHVWMWELDHKESSAPKNWCFQNVVLEKTLENPLDSKEIKPVNPKGNQSRIFIGRIDAKAKALILFHLMQRADSLEKTLILGKIEKGETEDEMVGWHHWLKGHESEQTGRQWRTGRPGALHSMGLQNQTWLRDWTTIIFLNELINT